jgi:predicted TIM-barrel fold metal-dependent hydrolase
MATQTRYELPKAVAPFAGEINDLDAHEAIPVKRWRDQFGPEVDAIIAADKMGFFDTTITEDETPIDSHNVWYQKMEKAPGAFDFKRRIEVLDYIGIKKQILFPGGLGLQAMLLNDSADNPKLFEDIKTHRKEYATQLIGLYNDWCIRMLQGQNRVHAVAILVMDDVDQTYRDLQRLIERGVRLVQIGCTTPPCGISPVHPRLDRVWALGAEAGVSFMLHVESRSRSFLATNAWKEAPAFEGWRLGPEFSLDPWTLTALHFPVQTFLTTMILGGAFDRHPQLHFGCQEFGAHWVGPMAENMDRLYKAAHFPFLKDELKLKRKPSEYIGEHIRAAPFDFEPVGTYIDRYGFEDVYCFATDFPHHEGGKQPIEKLANSLSGQSPAVLRKFFVENAKLVLPA